MKKIYNYVMFAAVAAAALVSCAKEMDKPEVAPQSEGIKVTVVTADEVETKTALSGEKSIVWSATDKVGFFNHTADVNVESSVASIDGSGKATFTATVPAAGTYYAYYPYQNETGSNAPTVDGVVSRIPNNQTPTPTSFDPKADLLLSDSFVADGSTDTPSTIKFRRLGAFIRIQFVDGTTGTKLAGEYASSVKIQGEENLSAKYRVHGVNGAVYQNSGYKAITATYDADTYALTTAGQYAFFGVRPQTFANGSTLTLTIVTGKYNISKTITMPKDVVLGAGDILPITVNINDVDFPVKVEKLWQKLSTSETIWFAAIGGSAGADFNIAIDNQNVYIPAFGGSKKMFAIDIATGNTVTEVNTSTVQSKGFDGSIFLSCARVVKKNDGTPVLLASNLFQDSSGDPTGRLYIWDNGVSEAPRVVTLNQYNAGRRLGDTWTTYGNYEDCWLIMSTQTGNGLVTFKVPTGASAGLISRLATETGDFCSYYPFPGDMTHGMFTWRGGTHDDGMAYRNRLVTINSTESAIKTEGAHTMALSKLDTWMGNWENNNGSGFNFIEYKGKR